MEAVEAQEIEEENEAEENEQEHVPSALLRPDGSRPTNAEIHAVHNDGRCFDDSAVPTLQQQYRAATAKHYEFDAFDPTSYVNSDGMVDRDMQATYEFARECQLNHERSRLQQAELDGSQRAAAGVGVQKDGTRADVAGSSNGEADGIAFAEDEGPNLQPSHDDKVQRGQTGMDLGFVKKPACQSRGSPPHHVKCRQCGKRQGSDLQMPSEVLETSWRANSVGWQEAAVGCFVMMAQMLRSGRDEEVVERCAVCNCIDCLLRAGIMRPEWRIFWLDGPRRPQDERETARKDQVAVLERNIRYMHDFAKKGILALLDVQHLMRYVAMNSQFVQEREKKFIATAMAVVENERTFGYRFQDPQRFVNRLANFIHAYMLYVVVPHIMDLSMEDVQWEAHLQKLIDTALPKAADVIYALMVEANAEQGLFELEPAAPLHDGFDPTKHKPPFGEYVQKHGRFVHRVGFGNEALMKMFMPDHFFERLQKAVAATPHYELEYVSSSRSKFANASNVYEALRVSNIVKGERRLRPFEIHVAMRALNGPYECDKRITASANGAAGRPTCATWKHETNVHPRLRYHNVWLAFGYDQIDAEQRVAMMLEYHPECNSVGLEQLRSGKGGKACYTLRPPQIGIPLKCDPSRPPTVKALLRLDVLTVLSPATYVKLGSQAQQARGAMGQRQGRFLSKNVVTRVVKNDGSVSLLGAPSSKPEHQGEAAQDYELARDMQTARKMTESARSIAHALHLHRNKRALPGLYLLPMESYFAYAQTKHNLDPAFAALDFETQYNLIETTAWERWWKLWEKKRPDKCAPHNVRVLVRALHVANGALNEFASEWGGLGKDATPYDVSPRGRGMHGHPSKLYANLNVIHRATLGASSIELYGLVQELLSSYHTIRPYAILFINAYETNSPEAQVTTFSEQGNCTGSQGRDTWLASKSTRAGVPEAVTRANVRDFPAHMDDPEQQSLAIKNAMKTAKFNADKVWRLFEPAIGDVVSRKEFETMGAQRTWAIERKKRERYERDFAASGWTCKRQYCKHFHLDYDSTFEDPVVQARKEYAQILKTLTNVECDLRQERLEMAAKRVDLANKRHAEDMQKEEKRQRQAQGISNAPAQQNGRRRPRIRAPHIASPPPADSKPKIRQAQANAKKRRKEDLKLIARFAKGELVEPCQSKFEEAMHVRYGGMCQYYVHNRRSERTIDDKFGEARRFKAAVLANAGDDEYEARNARSDAEAAVNCGAIDAEIADDADDVAEAASRELEQLAAAAPGNGADDSSFDMAADGLRLQQERRRYDAARVSAAEREEKWDDEVVRPASPVGRGLPRRARAR